MTVPFLLPLPVQRSTTATADTDAALPLGRSVLDLLGLRSYPEPADTRFQDALRFVLNQEVAAQHRRSPGRVMYEGSEADVGIDPPAQREFERRNPDVAQRMVSELDFLSQRGRNDPQARRLRNYRLADYRRAIYADIWNAVGAGRLPPGLDVLHFDTAVNHGPGVARRLLRESGGNPAKYLALREAEYQRLMNSPTADQPRGFYGEIPKRQRGWLEQRIPALRRMLGL